MRIGDLDAFCGSCGHPIKEEKEAYMIGYMLVGTSDPPVGIYFCIPCFVEIAGEEYLEQLKPRMRPYPAARRKFKNPGLKRKILK